MSTFDATHGYCQLLSKLLTTFMTPWGKFKFLRASTGFVSTGDEYCGDEVLRWLHDVAKVLDDILLHVEDFKSHVHRVWSLLQRCREPKITLNIKMTRFAESEAKFVGYIVPNDGISVDSDK